MGAKLKQLLQCLRSKAAKIIYFTVHTLLALLGFL